jgi:hypothetical protein
VLFSLAFVLLVAVLVVVTVRRRRPEHRYFIEGRRVSKEEFDAEWARAQNP